MGEDAWAWLPIPAQLGNLGGPLPGLGLFTSVEKSGLMEVSEL